MIMQKHQMISLRLLPGMDSSLVATRLNTLHLVSIIQHTTFSINIIAYTLKSNHDCDGSDNLPACTRLLIFCSVSVRSGPSLGIQFLQTIFLVYEKNGILRVFLSLHISVTRECSTPCQVVVNLQVVAHVQYMMQWSMLQSYNILRSLGCGTREELYSTCNAACTCTHIARMRHCVKYQ